MHLAVVQFNIAPHEPEKNFGRMEAFVARAAKKGADVVIFPEDCVMGSIFGDLTKLDTTHAARDRFRELAKKYAVDIVSGTRMEHTSDGDFSVSYYINKHGEVLGRYCKNHLYPSERAFLKPGIEAPVFDTAYGKAAIVICWDMLFPEIFQRLKAQGVQIIYCPSYWSREIADKAQIRDRLSEEHLLDALSLTRAVETNSVLAYCNAAGVVRNPNGSVDTLIGHSQIVMPCRGVLKRAPHHRETMLVQEVHFDGLETSKKIYHE